MKQLFLLTVVLLMSAFVHTNVAAKEESKIIYYLSTYEVELPLGGIDYEMKPISQIKDEFFGHELLMKIELLENGKIKFSSPMFGEEDFDDGNGVGTYTYSMWQKLADKEWLYNELYRLSGQTEPIEAVVYKPDDILYTEGNATETAYIFTESELFIMDIPITYIVKDGKRTEENIEEITSFQKYAQWFNDRIYRNTGKLVINTEVISDNVYFNKYKYTLPLRTVFERLGGNVEWDNERKAATVKYKEYDVIFNYRETPVNELRTAFGYKENENFTEGNVSVWSEYSLWGDRGISGKTLGQASYFINEGVTHMIEPVELMKKFGIDVSFDWETKTLYVNTD